MSPIVYGLVSLIILYIFLVNHSFIAFTNNKAPINTSRHFSLQYRNFFVIFLGGQKAWQKWWLPLELFNTHPELSPWAPMLDGAGLAVLWGGGVTAEEAEPAALELTGVMAHDAEGDKLAPEKRRRGRKSIRGLWFAVALQMSYSVDTVLHQPSDPEHLF